MRLLLEGEAGIGKTTLLQAALAAAEARGFRVLATRPAEADRALPWTGLGDLLAPLPDAAFADLPDPQRQALEVALLRRAASERTPDPRAVFTAFVNVVGSLAAERPVVVAADDLPWLDPPSARALDFFSRRARGPGVGLLATARVVDGAVETARASWFAQEDRVRLAPLSPAALHHLLHERLGVSLPRPAVLRLHRVCAGNAFHALEIAQRLGHAGLADAHGEWPLPADVRLLVSSHVSRLRGETRHELVLAAVAAHPTETLVRAETVTAAEEAGLIRRDGGRLQFQHPLYAEAIYAGASRAERRRAHAELARRESDRAERARHLALSVDAPDAQIATELELAAADARSRGAYETAAELLELAIDVTPPSDRDALERRRLDAAADWYGSGSLLQARELLVRLLDYSPGRRTRARALRLLALVHFREESVPQAVKLLEEASEAAADDDDLRAPAELELAFLAVNASFDFEGSVPHADRALECAERLGDSGVLSQALAVKAIADFLAGRDLDEDRLTRALALEQCCSPDVPVELHPLLIGGSLRLYVGEVATALRLLHTLADRMRDRGLEASMPLLLSVITWASCWSGRIGAAHAAAAEALELARVTGSESLVGYGEAMAALAASYAGDEEACRIHAEAALAGAERAAYVIHATWSLSALGQLELSRGDAAAAEATLRPMLELYEESPPPEPVQAFFLCDGVEALLGIGETARAALLNERLSERASQRRRTWAIAATDRCRALIAADTGDLAEARRSAEEAIAALRPGELPLELARSLLVLGQVERRAKRKASARAALEEAAAICDGIGARLWAERVRGELARVGGTSDGELSPTEVRVARLAADGLTNREIARAAFMSEKTVEANLSRVYRKLGLRSRTELARRFVDEAASPVATA